jgi:toxin ParE1/3/4
MHSSSGRAGTPSGREPLILSPRAKADIEEIWDYTEERWGLRQARSYTRELQKAFETIARDPRKGRACDDIRPGYRRFSVGSHIIFFLVDSHQVQVMRVLHQRMDFEQHL